MREKPVMKEERIAVAKAHEAPGRARKSSEDVPPAEKPSNTWRKCARTNGRNRARGNWPSCGRHSPLPHRRSTKTAAGWKSTTGSEAATRAAHADPATATKAAATATAASHLRVNCKREQTSDPKHRD